jgi:putative transposase
VSVARFIADQRTKYRVPQAFTCRLLGVSVSWFYKWIARAEATDGVHTDTDRRRVRLDGAVAAAFAAARGLHGSPRLIADLRDLGWEVSEKTVASSMRRQGLVARRIKRRGGLTRQDKTAPKFPDLVKRNFTAVAPNRTWVGDMTEIPTESGKLYLATVIDLYSRRLLGAAMGLHPDAELACAAITMAVTARGGRQVIWREEESERVIFHTDRGSTYTAHTFTALCRRLGVRQSMGRVGSCFDNAAAEAFFSSMEWEVLSRNRFSDTIQARAVVIDWCYTFYNQQRRHSAADGLSPANYEIRESKTMPQAA